MLILASLPLSRARCSVHPAALLERQGTDDPAPWPSTLDPVLQTAAQTGLPLLRLMFKHTCGGMWCGAGGQGGEKLCPLSTQMLLPAEAEGEAGGRGHWGLHAFSGG